MEVNDLLIDAIKAKLAILDNIDWYRYTFQSDSLKSDKFESLFFQDNKIK